MKKIIVGVIVIILGFCLFGVVTCHKQAEEQENLRLEQEALFNQEISDIQIPKEWYIQDGYDNITDWWKDLVSLKREYAYIGSETLVKVGEYLTTEQQYNIQNLSKMIQDSHSINEINDCIWLIEENVNIALEAKEQGRQQIPYSENIDNASTFKSAGVLFDNGYRYTWYSSNELYHYMTPQWNLGADGIYRDDNGYIIVASSTHPQGTIVPTPFGTGIVKDSGCATGTIDIYTAF